MRNISAAPQILTLILFLVSQTFLAGCAHKKVHEPLTLKRLQGKRVALAQIDAEKDERTHIEVGILNELLDKGRFEIVDRATVQDALVAYPAESDWQRLGKKVGADYVLSVRVKEFSVDERQGYDKVTEEDSLLTEESGESKPVVGTHFKKVRGFMGAVRLSCMFYDVADGAIIYQGFGVAGETLNSRDGSLPGKMSMLEKLTGKAITNFFEQMPD
jgi:hypothetical protein